MRYLRHLWKLLKDLLGFAKNNRAWWIVPIVVLLLATTLLIVGVSAISPFIYSLF